MKTRLFQALFAVTVISVALADELQSASSEEAEKNDVIGQTMEGPAHEDDPVAAAMSRRAAKKRIREEATRAIREEGAVRLQASRESMVATIVGEMVAIPGQNYLMGRTEVTQAQWEAVMGENPSTFTDSTRPVENVTWHTVQQFIEKINATEAARNAHIVFRLPTVAEWVFACRAGNAAQFARCGLLATGREGTTREMGWYMGNTGSMHMTKPVAQKKPNAWGLYDMHGNVAEWTKGDIGADFITICGGNFDSDEDYCTLPRCTHERADCNRSFSTLGFRLCAEKR